MPLVVQGTGGANEGYGGNDATYGGTYLAAAIDDATSVPFQFGFGRVDVTPDTLIYSYVTASGQVLDSFSIGPPPPDTTPPTAALAAPLDNGPFDQNPAAGQALITTALSSFQIQLTDNGDGIDDASVLPSTVTLSRNSIPLVQGLHYSVSYTAATNLISLTPLPAWGTSFGNGVYELGLSAGIEDLADNALVPVSLDSRDRQHIAHRGDFSRRVGWLCGHARHLCA